MAQLTPVYAYQGSNFGTPEYRVYYRDADGVEVIHTVDQFAYRDVIAGGRWEPESMGYVFDSDDPMTDNPTDEADAFGARW